MNEQSTPRTTKLIQTPPEMLKELTETFRSGPSPRLGNTGFTIAAGTVVLIAVIVIGLRVRRWMQGRRNRPRPKWLFRQALNRLNLPGSDRWLLRRMARAYGSDAPTAILLSPRLLALAARAYQRRCSHPSLRDAIRQRADSLCHLLFDGPLPEAEELPTATTSPPTTQTHQYSST